MPFDQCPKNCPGCQHRHFTQEKSEEQKLGWLIEALAPWHLLIEKVKSPPSPLRTHYRKKITLHTRLIDKNWKAGFILRKKSKKFAEEFLPITHCPIHDPQTDRALHEILKAIPEHWPLHAISLCAEIATLVLKSKPFSNENTNSLTSAAKNTGIKSLYLHFNPCAGHHVFSSRDWVPLYTEQTTFQTQTGVFEYGPQSFQQLIPHLSEHAYRSVYEWFSPNNEDRIVDLYSGLGISISHFLPTPVMGIELCGESIHLAQKHFSQFESVKLLRGRCSERVPQLEEFSPTLLFANPPRTGLEQEIISFICSSKNLKKMAYLSCSAGTMARDLSLIEKNSPLRVQKIIPYDFFPNTHHVECLALLS